MLVADGVGKALILGFCVVSYFIGAAVQRIHLMKRFEVLRGLRVCPNCGHDELEEILPREEKAA